MKLKIGMSFELGVDSEKSFLNELILETKKVFQQEATGKFLGFLLENVDQQMCDQLVRMGSAQTLQDPELKILAHPPKMGVSSCCAHPKYKRYRKERKKLMTGIGTVPTSATVFGAETVRRRLSRFVKS